MHRAVVNKAMRQNTKTILPRFQYIEITQAVRNQEGWSTEGLRGSVASSEDEQGIELVSRRHWLRKPTRNQTIFQALAQKTLILNNSSDSRFKNERNERKKLELWLKN